MGCLLYTSNVGYTKVDKAGIYNILIMEEKQSIVAVGAGASTKIGLPKEKTLIDEKTGNPKQIVRTENVKDVEQYILSLIHIYTGGLTGTGAIFLRHF